MNQAITTTSMIRLSLVTLTIFASGDALPGGAPSLACSSMTPYHFAFQSQPLNESPFTLRQSKIVYTPGNDTVVVSLMSARGRTFKGFLIKALNPVTNRPIGKFLDDTAVGSRDRCHAATHVNPAEKTFAAVHWISDDVDEDDNYVVFEATFVESFRKFYVGVESKYKGVLARRQISTLKASKAKENLSINTTAGTERPTKVKTTRSRSRLSWF